MPATPTTEARFQELQQALQQREQLLGRIPGVVKAQIGYRTRDGRLTDEPAILITVVRKRPISAVAPGEQVGCMSPVMADFVAEVADERRKLRRR